MWEAGGSRGWGSKALSARLVCEFRYACKSRRPTTGGGGHVDLYQAVGEAD